MALCRPAGARHNGDYLNQVTTRLQTPHIAWARPYAGGRPRVLFLVPRTIAPREIVELWQRFDMEWDAVTLAHGGLLSFESDAGAAPYDLAVEGTSIEEKTEELRAKLGRPWDAFVLANASLDALPKEAQYKILQQVAEGAGLLFTFGRNSRLPIFRTPLAEERDQILAGVPLAGLDFLRTEKALQALGARTEADLPARLVETFRFHKGRIAVLAYGTPSGTYYGGHSLTPPEPFSLQWPARYEGMLSLVYKALLWTVPAKQPRVRFSALPGDGLRLDRRMLPRAVSVGLQVAPAGGLKGQLVVVVRDTTNAEEHRASLPLALRPGDATLSVPLPALKAGGHFLDLVVRSGAGTEAWASVFLRVESALALREFGAPQESYEQGAAVPVAAGLTGPARAGARLRVFLTDTEGRLYFQREVAVAPGKEQITLDCSLDGARSIASRLHGELLVGSEVVDARDQILFAPRRSSGEFRSILWGGLGCGTTGLGWMANREMRKAGFNAVLAHPSADGAQERTLAQADLPLVCYAYRIMGGADDKGWRKDNWGELRKIEDGCFYNPQVQAAARQSVLDRIRPVIPFGPTLYSLGDENHYDYRSGFSPAGQQAFREYLKRTYGSLDDLNRAWRTEYRDWSDVALLPRDEALKRGLWPMVHEHMAFNESEYADYHHFLADAIRSADRFAIVGAEGSEPGDLEKTITGMEIWGPYADKRGNELLRSLAGPDVVRGNWWGGYSGSHGARAGALLLWKQLLSGAVNTSLFYAATGSEGLFHPDLSFADYFVKMLPEVREIYAGIGQLVSRGRVADDGIAIHWSQASEHAASLFSALGSPKQSHGNLLGTLDRCGLGYRYLTTRMVEDGKLRPDSWRVLFLPCSQAISNREAEAIRRYVEAGGTVVADVGAGMLDGHCQRLWNAGPWKGQLDDLLGLNRTGEPAPKSTRPGLAEASPLSLDGLFGGAGAGRPAATAAPVADGRRWTLVGVPLRVDAAVAAGDARPAAMVDGVPVVLARTVGKGKVGTLNFSFPSGEDAQGLAFVRNLLAAVGVTPTGEMANGDGYLLRRFEVGALTLVGVVRDGEGAGDALLRFAQPAYAYDVRSGEALGRVSQIRIATAGPRARLFALAPAATKRLSVQATGGKRGRKVGIVVRLDAGGVDPGGRVIRVRLLRPDGSEATCYRSYLTLTTGGSELQLPTALNDPAGTWSVVATDVATGVSG